MPSKTAQRLKEKVLELLEKTTYSHSEIARNLDISSTSVLNIQNAAIEECKLDKKYRRLANGVVNWQKDEVIELLRTTDYSLTKITKETKFKDMHAIKAIQDNAIKAGILDKNRRRLNNGVQYQKDEIKERVLELLKGTYNSITQIADKSSISYQTVRNIQDNAVKEGLLDEKYRRNKGGTQYKKEEVIKMLKETNYNLTEIAKKFNSCTLVISDIQNNAINHGVLDSKYKRSSSGKQIQYQKDEIQNRVLKLLEKTNKDLTEIASEVDSGITYVRNIQNNAIKQGLLDESRRRLLGGGGIIKYQKDKVLELLKKTNYNSIKIAKETEVSDGTVRRIQDEAIKKNLLDKGMRRPQKSLEFILQNYYQENEKIILENKTKKIVKKLKKAIELFKTTNYSLEKISNKVELCYNSIKLIQDNAIKEGLLDEKYRRNGRSVRYQKDKIIELLRTTTCNLNEIGEKVGLSGPGIKYIQNNAIKQGLLDEKYRRLAGGTVKYQKDEVIELLRTTDYTSRDISQKVGLSRPTITHIQNEAIAKDFLDESRRRPLYKNNNNLEAVLRDYRGKEIV